MTKKHVGFKRRISLKYNQNTSYTNDEKRFIEYNHQHQKQKDIASTASAALIILQKICMHIMWSCSGV